MKLTRIEDVTLEYLSPRRQRDAGRALRLQGGLRNYSEAHP